MNLPATENRPLRALPADWSIEPVGDRCLMIRLGRQVDEAVSGLVHAVAAHLLQHALPGVVDVVPAFTTVAKNASMSSWQLSREKRLRNGTSPISAAFSSAAGVIRSTCS